MAAADASVRSPPPQDSVDARLRVSKIIAEDVEAADLQWSLFVAALRSYRYDTVLRPFPTSFADQATDTKRIDELRDVAARVPPLVALLPAGIPRESWELLLWVLTCGGVRLRTQKKEDVPELSGDSAVDAVFEVEHSPQVDRRFEAARGDREVFFAYHGSRLDNFYSILHNGLLAHMNKNSLYGTGTYLSSELSVSATFSPAGYGWQHSQVSPELSCVAMCEVVDHPDVKCQDRCRSKPSRAYARDSMGGKVPEKYYLVQNNSVVRVKYLLVYTAVQPPPTPEILPAGMMRPVNRASYTPRWHDYLCKNKSWLMVAAYAALLCGIGLSSSRVGHKLMVKLFYW
ncbi:protein mono-ADP-ribosyltransferase PARP16 [Dermacentor silvarum]|uniref:protein mono-ADP-ribosyltransferase PARP16 n=1 Tax=Dermacentor silvarum TaxID=543639 RepID=UPI00189881FA|nr:protein mono-ADP-ribosyltransferase PARP16 [Dermacentor silvarum]